MPNSSYWKERFKQLEAAQNRKGADTYLEIENQYRQAQKEIEGKINTWYQRFATNNNLSMAEARRMLRDKELAELKWNVKDYIKQGQANAFNGQWIKELENASARFHISRLEALKLQTQQSLELMFGNQLDSIDTAMKRIYLDGYYHTAYELQKGFGIGWDIAGLDQRKIEKVIRKPWAVDAKNFSNRIWSNKEKLISEVHREITQDIMLGRDPQKAIDNISKKMNTSKVNASRLIMTEEAYFSSAAQKDCFQDLGVEQYEIVATLDSHTSDICQNLDGQVFPMKDFEPGVTAPPFHVYCRSTTVPYFEEDFGQVGKRAARGEDGKTYYVSADMTYKEWKEEFINDTKIKRLKKSESNDNIKEIKILNREEVVLKAKEFHEDFLNENDVIGKKDLIPTFEYVAKKIGYDKVPKIVDALEFDKFVQESPVGILYRGVNANTMVEVEEYVNNFKLGKLFTGFKQAYGHGIYFSPKESVAQIYKKANQYGTIIHATLTKDAKVVDYKTIMKEYALTGADIVQYKKNKTKLRERWESILGSVSEYAAIAGYDAIAMNGFNNNEHIIVLNRGKVVIKE